MLLSIFLIFFQFLQPGLDIFCFVDFCDNVLHAVKTFTNQIQIKFIFVKPCFPWSKLYGHVSGGIWQLNPNDLLGCLEGKLCWLLWLKQVFLQPSIPLVLFSFLLLIHLGFLLLEANTAFLFDQEPTSKSINVMNELLWQEVSLTHK